MRTIGQVPSPPNPIDNAKRRTDHALEGLEKELQSAAQIGQALLARHEAYIKDAEEERRKMGVNVDKLEADKKELEAANARTIEENRYLLDQLEEMNNAVSTSDAHILSLNTTLQSTRKELERLTVLAAQASHLEAQLASMEKEQADLQNQVVSKGNEERTAVQRWKGAERIVSTLHEQVDRIEREAKEERARHAEVVARFERRRAVERELESAAGRLKGAAAATTLDKDGNSTVVSHFVKDILQDNANLQMGIVELREMLIGSNEEVENLREQMMLHQPVQSYSERPRTGEDLDSEIARMSTSEAAADFHVHHHYHAAPAKEVVREKPGIRRPKKRRNVTSPGLRTPASGTQTPRTPIMRPTPASSAATILSQTSVSIPPPSQPSYAQRWSIQSSQAASSVALSSLPNSPQDGSLFDVMNDGLDSSRPTTPGSMTLGSPSLKPWHSKRGSDVSMSNVSAHASDTTYQIISNVLQRADSKLKDDSDTATFPLLEHSTILEEPEDETIVRPSTNDSNLETGMDAYTPMRPMRPRMHRASSHESMFSARGLEMPKLRTQTSQMLGNRGFTPRASFGATISVGPVTSSTAAVGKPTTRQRGYDSSNYNRLLLATSPTTSAETNIQEKTTIGKRMGGWMSGKWGFTPTVSKSESKAKEALSAVERATQDNYAKAKKVANRSSTTVEPVNVDKSLLQETLGEV
ncbi:hypothetical protein P7C71_g4053, partial [Lecanoromycetidae sp. Uapishka_2]